MFQRIICRLQPSFKRNANPLCKYYQGAGLRSGLFQRKSILPTFVATGYGIFSPMVYALDSKKDRKEEKQNDSVKNEEKLKK